MSTPVTPLGPVQVAVYETLTDDPTLMGLITGVFDEVPEGQPLPYVVIGEAVEQPDNHHGGFGRETVETLHIWSGHRGFSEAQTIAARAIALLDHQALDVTGQHHIATRYEFAQTLTDPDPHLRHLVLRFRIVTEQE